jgi:hypothetical protein
MEKLRLRSRKPRLTAVGIRCDTLYPQKLALSSPTSGGRSVDIVRWRTRSHGVCLFVVEIRTENVFVFLDSPPL